MTEFDIVGADGSETISNGGSALVQVVSSGGAVSVLNGGTDTSATILSGASITVASAGTASAVTVLSGGSMTASGLIDVDASTIDSGATLDISGESFASGAQFVLSSAFSSFVAFGNGGDPGYILPGGILTLEDVTLSSGSLLSLGPGAYVTNVTVQSGGVLDGPGDLQGSDNYDSGLVSGVMLGQLGSANLDVESGGVASSVIETGVTAYLIVNSGAEAVGTIMNGSDAVLYANSGGIVSGTVLASTASSGGAYIELYGSAVGTVISNHGDEQVLSGGVASGTVLLNGGQDEIFASGIGVSTTVSSGGVQFVGSGGVTSGTVVSGSGYQEVGFDGTASGTRVLTEGTLLVSSGGFASAAHVSSGGSVMVLSGGTVVSGVVSSGGEIAVSSGGNDSATKILGGGTLWIASGGTGTDASAAVGAVVVDGGVLLQSGAAATVLRGTLSGKGQLVEDGPGRLTLSGVESGFTGQTVVSGGVVEIATSAGPKGAAVFTGSGRLTLDAVDQPASGTVFSQTLSNFDAYGDTLDLVGLTKSAGAKATLSGATLTIKDGGYIAKFKLAGSGASQYMVTADGAGGLLVRASSGASISPLVHAMAAFDAPAASPGATTLLSAAGASISLLETTGGLRSSTRAASD